MEAFFERIKIFCPYLLEHDLTISSSNSFPHSSGIASSASSMSALALCLLSVEEQGAGFASQERFNQKASFLARLGSGSAARSIKGPVTIWGKNNAVSFSSDLYAVNFEDKLSPIFK